MKKQFHLPMPVRYLINTGLLLVLVLGTLIYNGGALNRATKSVIIQVGIYSMLAVSLNICTGYLGQLPLGHAGFMAVGAYTGAIVWRATTALPGPLSIIIGLIAAGLLAAVFGILIGNICIGTGVGDLKHYYARPTSINDLHGAGAFLLMCTEAAQVL